VPALAALIVSGLVVVGVALGSATFSDASGDTNDAPDITSLTVSESPTASGYLFRVALGNATTMPADSGIGLLFDLDRSARTGADGAEAALRYSNDGAVSFLRWSGFELVPAPANGIKAAYSNGALTVSVDRAVLGDATSFGISAVASRAQTVAGTRLVASDFAANGASVFTSPGPAVFSDPAGDEDAAPDISTIGVSDASNGILTFRITTANYEVLGADKLVGLGFTLVGRPANADEMFLTYQGGENGIIVEREIDGLLTQDTPPDRVTSRFEDHVLTIAVHRSELDDVARFRFGIITADLVGEAEGEGDDGLGEIEAVDLSPEQLQEGTLHSYALEHRPPVRLTAGRPSGLPAFPRSGKTFTVSVVVTRSDTGKVVRSGRVACSAFVGKSRVRASGRFRSGRAQCSIRVPGEQRPARVRGTMTIRAAGASIRSGFTFAVR
jgi:hypothetical protein